MSSLAEQYGHLQWGTYGKEGLGPVVRIPLNKLSNDHLVAILETQPHIDNPIDRFCMISCRNVIESILEDRFERDEYVDEWVHPLHARWDVYHYHRGKQIGTMTMQEVMELDYPHIWFRKESNKVFVTNYPGGFKQI